MVMWTKELIQNKIGKIISIDDKEIRSTINKSLLNDFTIVIETPFSSLNNTLEQIKNKDNYQICLYLFIINEIEFFISTLEIYISCYINGHNCRLISFEKYLNKLKFKKNIN